MYAVPASMPVRPVMPKMRMHSVVLSPAKRKTTSHYLIRSLIIVTELIAVDTGVLRVVCECDDKCAVRWRGNLMS
ncbi:unnamed protein product [Toxocara canis]|uniref:Uncharacterized protein n=1 Tax=Toxocara canis TaxID=6265 RepID=A0A183TXG5_TOXCA|nr:unnamed protein product [Toxocara canis]